MILKFLKYFNPFITAFARCIDEYSHFIEASHKAKKEKIRKTSSIN